MIIQLKSFCRSFMLKIPPNFEADVVEQWSWPVETAPTIVVCVKNAPMRQGRKRHAKTDLDPIVSSFCFVAWLHVYVVLVEATMQCLGRAGGTFGEFQRASNFFSTMFKSVLF